MVDFLLCLGIVIDFVPPSHTIREADGQVMVCARITQGSLERDVLVMLSTEDASARGEYRKNAYVIHYTQCI